VELLPVMAFNDQDVPPSVEARGLRNYWGYSPHSFYSPHPRYCVEPERGTHQNEFRELVEALHAAGLDRRSSGFVSQSLTKFSATRPFFPP